ncbi:hypothetical protein CXQ85_002975 [Candidozyma haemuli]|uniref:Uncharacterized protein n=1 Tax=Candidozyma haemuli TaxID=45357 RepID=A0A2V1AZJ5_9ASCO|nr:hypothetical protein CXQ85_002975 [[Candida] haemuloni]PVH23244.1 hypothetical protein CXQ85_002975 [[Candida] haemuloni]
MSERSPAGTYIGVVAGILLFIIILGVLYSQKRFRDRNFRAQSNLQEEFRLQNRPAMGRPNTAATANPNAEPPTYLPPESPTAPPPTYKASKYDTRIYETV